MYVGYIQFLMIGFVFLESYKDARWGQLIFNNLVYSVPILFVLFILLHLVLGRIDTLLGLREEEMRNASASNPVMMELLEKINELSREVQQLNEKLSEDKIKS